MLSTDTIAAPITAPGAVCVVRVSGPQTKAVLRALIPAAERLIESPGRLILCRITSEGEPLDEGLAAFFAAPHSYTGEDAAELSVHGSPYIIGALMEALFKAGARAARAGEFTGRAYLNGKMDLSQAEAVADLVAAESRAQADAAREQLEGRLSKAISELGEPLRDLLSEIEAYIDFPEDDIEPASVLQWKEALGGVRVNIASYIASFSSGRLLRDGASVVIAGLPNAGKSSLLNRLLGEERAIVTPVAGTTRDSIEARGSINGLLVHLWDTAGLTDESKSIHRPDEIERLGIAHSWKRLRSADLIVYLADGTREFEPEGALFGQVRGLAKPVILAANKADLAAFRTPPEGALPVSAVTGKGVEELKSEIYGRLVGEHKRGAVYITTERHFEALVRGQSAIDEALSSLSRKEPAEFTSLLIRSALGHLEEIIGVTTNEEILGRIFSKFCIGK